MTIAREEVVVGFDSLGGAVMVVIEVVPELRKEAVFAAFIVRFGQDTNHSSWGNAVKVYKVRFHRVVLAVEGVLGRRMEVESDSCHSALTPWLRCQNTDQGQRLSSGCYSSPHPGIGKNY